MSKLTDQPEFIPFVEEINVEEYKEISKNRQKQKSQTRGFNRVLCFLLVLLFFAVTTGAAYQYGINWCKDQMTNQCFGGGNGHGCRACENLQRELQRNCESTVISSGVRNLTEPIELEFLAFRKGEISPFTALRSK